MRPPNISSLLLLVLVLPIAQAASWEPLGTIIEIASAVSIDCAVSDSADQSTVIVNESGAYINTYNDVSKSWVSHQLTYDRRDKADISSDGTVVVLSLPMQNLVEVYRKVNNVWSADGALAYSGFSLADLFGLDVALSGDGNVIAASAIHYSDTTYTNRGMVNTYIYNAGTSVWELGSSLSGKEMNNQYFGSSVALNSDGSRLIVGAVEDENDCCHTGLVWVFSWDSGDWTQYGGFVMGVAHATAKFGTDVSISDNGLVIAVSAPSEDNEKGIVRVYELNQNQGIFEQSGNAISGVRSNDRFGYRISMSSDGTKIAIGAYGASNVNVYHYDDSSGSFHLSKGYRHETIGDEFGIAVAMARSGTRIFAGSLSYFKNISYDDNLLNYAIGKQATQSSVSGSFVASQAVNGDIYGYVDDVNGNPINNANCISTDAETNPWWMVDMAGMLCILWIY